MSNPAFNDLETRGYFLPEDSQSRLKKLRDHMQFLSGLAQPRTWKEEQEYAPEVSVGRLAICLELLAEQADLVLQEVSWPARREVAADEPDQVEAQRLGHMPRRPTGVGEELAVYATGLACLPSAPALPAPDASPSHSVRSALIEGP